MTATVLMVKNILDENERLAEDNTKFFADKKVLALNIMGSPGSGKTSLLEETAKHYGNTLSWSVVDGDVAGSFDADRLDALGVPSVQLTTGGACHLDSRMVAKSFDHVPFDDIDLLVVENVGNLICPASFDLGTHESITVIAATEGEDKPLKYPLMFRNSSLLVINKIDLAPYVDFDAEKMKKAALDVNGELTIIETSCKTGEGLDKWFAWLDAKLANHRR